MLLTGDAQRAGLPVPVVTVTDTPLARETDYGRVDDHSSAIRTPDDRAAHVQPGARLSRRGAEMVYGQWNGGRISVSSSASDSTALPNVAPATRTGGGHRRAIRRRAGCPMRCRRRSANGCRSISTIRSPTPPSRSPPAPPPSARRFAASRCRPSTAPAHCGSTRPGKPLTVALPYGETPWVRITAVATDDGSAGRAVRHHRLHRHPVRRERLRPSGQPAPHRAGSRAATEFGCRAMGSGLRAAGPAGLRRGPDRHAVRGGHGAVAGGAGEPEPDADRAAADGGDADGVGAGAAGPQSGRPDQRSRAPRGRPATPTRSTCWVRPTPPPTAIPAPRGPRRRASCNTRLRRRSR